MTRRKPDNPIGPVLRLPAVLGYCGLGITQLDELVKTGQFPQPIKISDAGRARAWVKAECDAWLAARMAARDQAQAPKKPAKARA